MIEYVTFSISIVFISWIAGLIINATLNETAFYQNNLSNFNFIKSEYVNRNIGLGMIKWVVKNTFFKFFNPKLKLKKKASIDDLNYLRSEMTSAEIGHLIGFAFVSIFALVKFFNFNFLFGFTITIVNVLMNLYPSLLQQANKRRIDELKRKLLLVGGSPKQPHSNLIK